jgi:hypothetical protein
MLNWKEITTNDKKIKKCQKFFVTESYGDLMIIQRFNWDLYNKSMDCNVSEQGVTRIFGLRKMK